MPGEAPALSFGIVELALRPWAIRRLESLEFLDDVYGTLIVGPHAPRKSSLWALGFKLKSLILF
jgi:hypothetical protein